MNMAALSMPYWSIKLRTSNPVYEGNSVIAKRNVTGIVGSTTIKSLPTALRDRPITIKNVDVLCRDPYRPFKIKDEGLEKEIQGIIKRLKDAVERVKESEIQKFMGRVRGTEFEKDGVVLAETMSREIVGKFVERPIRYLRSCDGNPKEKIEDINVLVGILENSCCKHTSC